MRRLATLPALALVCATAAGQQADIPLYPKVKVETSKGEFVLQLNGHRAPITVANFLQYVQEGHYSGTIFHRVIDGFMAQGGGFTADFTKKTARATIVNESGNGLQNRRGTIAMARTNAPHSADAQFFINLVDNVRLDPSPTRWGYAVFGEVVEGMDVLDEIALTPTGPGGPFKTDVPQTSITIEKMTLLEEGAGGE